METDPEKIKNLGKEKEEENWKFREFLKQIDMEPEEIDAIVHRIYKEVSSQMDCAACRNCCKELIPALDQEDIEQLSKASGMSVDQFMEQYVVKDEFGEYIFRDRPCPLFKDNSCMYYDDRPKNCQSYPHLHKEGFVFRTMNVIRSCSVCPIVYNVYERLKGELWHYDFDDFDDYDDFDDFDDFDDYDELEDIDMSDILEILHDLYVAGGFDENA